MKSLMFIFCMSLFVSFGQVTDTVEVSFMKSAYLVFKDKTVQFDCGSEDVFVRNSENKVILQAGIENFEETNLFVQSGGEMFLFIVVYSNSPKKYLYDFSRKSNLIVKSESPSGSSGTTSVGKSETFSLSEDTSEKDSIIAVYEKNSKKMLSESDKIANRGVVKYKLGLYLKDIAIKDDKVYMEFESKNTSNIPYLIDFMQYRVRPVKRRIKGESFQEIELTSILEFDRPNSFQGKSTNKFVIVMDKFVLTKNKKLVIEYWENNGDDMNLEGGRKIEFDVFSYDILNIRNL